MINIARERQLQITTSAAADIHWFASVSKRTSFDSEPLTYSGTITSATTTTIIDNTSGATGGLSAAVEFLSIRNTHATDPNTVTVIYDNGTTDIQIYKAVLLAGERMEYNNG